MNKFKLWVIFIIIFKSNFMSIELNNNKSFIYQFIVGLRSLTPSINKIITFNRPILHLLVPILGVYGVFTTMEVLAERFGYKLSLNRRKFPWWKLGLTFATLIIQPKWDFYKGLNFFTASAAPNALLEENTNNFVAMLTKYDLNHPKEKEIMQKIHKSIQEIKEIQKITEEINN